MEGLDLLPERGIQDTSMEWEQQETAETVGMVWTQPSDINLSGPVSRGS